MMQLIRKGFLTLGLYCRVDCTQGGRDELRVLAVRQNPCVAWKPRFALHQLLPPSSYFCYRLGSIDRVGSINSFPVRIDAMFTRSSDVFLVELQDPTQ